MELENTIRNFIAENFMYEDAHTTLAIDDSFLDNGILDSTGVMELVAFIEENFNIKVEDEDLTPDNLDSIANIIQYIEKKQTAVAAISEK